MGSVGDCCDNALCESFFASLKCELIDRRRFATRYEARTAVFEYIEGFYNIHRRHFPLGFGYLSPANFERSFKKTARIPNRKPSEKRVNSTDRDW